MFEWLGRILRRSDDDERQRFFDTIDSLNARAAGGKPKLTQGQLGTLMIRSRTLVLGDPQYLPYLEIPNFTVDQLSISAKLRQYPSGGLTVTELMIDAANGVQIDSHRKIGTVAIDSAKLVVADKADLKEYWTETGEDRIGVISTPRDDTVLRTLKKRFDLETVQVNGFRAEVVGPVSVELEQEIDAYLKSVPQYAQFPFMYFYVQTNNSFDRVNFMEDSWCFMPIGNGQAPTMFACETGRGDGTYDVNCGFAGDVPVLVTIPFIEDHGEGEDAA
jgi:hypothetical protein